MKNNPQVSRVLEIFWLIVSILTLFIAIQSTLKEGFGESYVFYIMTSLALFLYITRRNMRRKAGNN